MHSEFVYVLRSGPYFKIGRTTDISKRIAQLKIQLPFEVELFKVINTNYSNQVERDLHKLYAHARVNGEWFQLSDNDIATLNVYPCSVDCSDWYQGDSNQRIIRSPYQGEGYSDIIMLAADIWE